MSDSSLTSGSSAPPKNRTAILINYGDDNGDGKRDIDSDVPLNNEDKDLEEFSLSWESDFDREGYLLT